jgi:ankyrin repeat protein
MKILKSILVAGLLFANAIHAQTDNDLSLACKAGDLAAVKKAIAAGSNINALRPDGSPIMTDAFLWPEIIKYMIDNGADPNAGTYPVLMIAAGSYAVETVKVLLENGADPNKPQVKTSVHPIAGLILAEKAKKKPNKKVLKIFETQLEAAGGTLDTIKAETFTFQQTVNATNCIECLELLIKHKADINRKDEVGNDVLINSTMRWMDLTENFEKFGGMLENQFGFKVPGWYYDNIKVGNSLEELKLLVKAGADVNYINPVTKATPLIAAVTAKFAEGSKFLINQGADVNVKTADKRDVLSASIAIKDLELVKLIVEKGADIHAEIFTLDAASGQFANGFSALTIAVINDDIEIAKYLIDAGVKPKEGVSGYHINPKNNCRYRLKNKTAIYYAIENENTNMVNMLTDNYKRWNFQQMEMKQPENSSESTMGNVTIKTTYCYKVSGKFSPSSYAKKMGNKELANNLKSKGL